MAFMEILGASLLPAAITFVVGVLLFLTTKLGEYYYFEPRKDLLQEMHRSRVALIYFANVYTNVRMEGGILDNLEKREDCERELRKRGAELFAKNDSLISNNLFRFGLPKSIELNEVGDILIFLSNQSFMGDPDLNNEKSIRAQKLLGIRAVK